MPSSLFRPVRRYPSSSSSASNKPETSSADVTEPESDEFSSRVVVAAGNGTGGGSETLTDDGAASLDCSTHSRGGSRRGGRRHLFGIGNYTGSSNADATSDDGTISSMDCSNHSHGGSRRGSGGSRHRRRGVAQTTSSNNVAVDPLGSSSSHHRRNLKSAMKKQNSGRRLIKTTSFTEIEVRLPGRLAPVRRRTSISFAEQEAQVKKVEPLTDNPQELWLQSEELQEIKAKLQQVIDQSNNKGGGLLQLATKNHCTRGLERYMDGKNVSSYGLAAGTSPSSSISSSLSFEERKFLATESVLGVQHDQQMNGVFNETEISQHYQRTTIGCQLEAAQRASQDAAEVQEYLKSTRRRLRRRQSM